MIIISILIALIIMITSIVVPFIWTNKDTLSSTTAMTTSSIGRLIAVGVETSSLSKKFQTITVEWGLMHKKSLRKYEFLISCLSVLVTSAYGQNMSRKAFIS